jgi:hypothetical protein
MKNVVVMINFKKDGQEDKAFVSNTSFAWKKWCDKNKIDFMMWEDPLYIIDEVPSIVQRWHLIDMLESNKLSYDQICCVDYDTFPMWHCPNFFEMTNGKFTCALDNGEPHQLNRSIRMVRTNWFPEVMDVSWANYFNAGFVTYNSSHQPAFKELINFFDKEVKETRNWYRINKSTDFGDDQTIINFLTRKHKFEITYLPRSFNVMDHHMRCMLFNGEDSNKRIINAIQTMEDCAHLFHFTGNDNERFQLTSYILQHTSNKY